jgi:regulator of replication initiation timing
MAKKLSPTLVKEAVLAEAKVIKRKREIYAQLQALNEEIQQLDERGMVGTFGFEGNPNDRVHVSKTGFVNDFQNISHVARLAAEFAEADAAEESIQEENTKLKAKLEALQAQLDESNKAVKAEEVKTETK